MSNANRPTGNDRSDWRRSLVEDVIWPEQLICDPHHHLWGHEGDRYFAADLAADISDGHAVLKTVYVECGSAYRESGPLELAPVGETEFVVAQDSDLAAIAGRTVIAGIIGFADLRLGAVLENVLARHIDAAGGRFRGVRHATAWDPHPEIINHQEGADPGVMREPRFIEGVRTLGRMGLTYDSWLYHPQIPDVVELARAAPETTIVLDHLGAPVGIGPYKGRREEVLNFCREHLTRLAAEPNARLKLGGIGMPLFGNAWHRLESPPSSETMAAAWGDHIRWCIDTFGPDRVMFESNFPPDGRSCSYRTLWNAFKRIAETYSQPERDRLFHDTATQVYSL